MLIQQLRRLFTALIINMSLKTIMIYCFCYFGISYTLLKLAGETELVDLDQFFYWIVVTSSTVGYGDFSPATESGKWVTSLVVIPFGLSLFALIITHASIYINSIVQRKLKGLHMSQANNHFLIIGFHPQRTPKLIELLHSDKYDKKIVLCVAQPMTNPFTHLVEMIQVKSFSDNESMKRTNIANAKSIIIDTEQDDETLRAALYCKSINPLCHTTAYFQDESVAKLLKDLHPSIEIVPSVSIEMLAKASVDPGSSQLHQQLLDNTIGMTQFSDVYDGINVSVKELFVRIKEKHNATLIGLKVKGKAEVLLNPKFEKIINTGDTVYYICHCRIDF
ncbi:ion channel [Marinicellulosiphila megalodicopiae]|uniref:ion channel n=1 Tax=Marinicellulosiphila megalodicopiae TaxID=2724896 RepID=UPI003BAE9608